MQEKKVFIRAFGLNEFGKVDMPKKFSNVRLSRLEVGSLMGCSWCFPHEYETTNSTISKNRKSWKFRRMKQYRKSKSIETRIYKRFFY